MLCLSQALYHRTRTRSRREKQDCHDERDEAGGAESYASRFEVDEREGETPGRVMKDASKARLAWHTSASRRSLH